jgi:4-carboxymuconolactone decarboxylase
MTPISPLSLDWGMATKTRKAAKQEKPAKPAKHDSKKQAYINKIARARGFVLDYHKVLVKHDFEAMQRINEFLEGIYLKRRRLDVRTRELLIIVGLFVQRATQVQVRSHMKVALDLGVSKEELLEAVELVIALAGFVPFQTGLRAWCDVTGATGIEPTIAAYWEAEGSPA